MKGRGKGEGGRGRLRPVLVLLALFLGCFAFSLPPHPANVASSQIKVQPDGTFVARVRFDVAAFVTDATPTKADDDAMNAFLDGSDGAMKAALAGAEARFRAGFSAQSDGTLDKVAFPSVEDVRRYLASNPEPRIPAMLTTVVEGHLPKGARTVAFRYPAVIDTVIQTVEFPYKEPFSEPVEAGRSSTPLTIPTAEEVARLAASMNAPTRAGKREEARGKTSKPAIKPMPKRTPLAVAAKRSQSPKPNEANARGNRGEGDASEKAKVPTKSKPQAGLPAAPPHESKAATVTPRPVPSSILDPRSAIISPSPPPFLTYLQMGYTHILPQGLDHILFVLGLFLLGSNAKALLKQITAFTVAHSITLALATLNVVRLPGRIIEPLIAVSIAFVAIENLTTKEVRPWRTAVVFLFGLVHGMGFAEVFRDAGLSGGGLVTALLSFNVGVELGQLSVVALALLAVGWFRRDVRYRRFVVVPASLLIAAVALFWTAQRTLGIGV